ncbi:hypothetical protein [Enterobacter ludwigii]
MNPCSIFTPSTSVSKYINSNPDKARHNLDNKIGQVGKQLTKICNEYGKQESELLQDSTMEVTVSGGGAAQEYSLSKMLAAVNEIGNDMARSEKTSYNDYKVVYRIYERLEKLIKYDFELNKNEGGELPELTKDEEGAKAKSPELAKVDLKYLNLPDVLKELDSFLKKLPSRPERSSDKNTPLRHVRMSMEAALKYPSEYTINELVSSLRGNGNTVFDAYIETLTVWANSMK